MSVTKRIVYEDALEYIGPFIDDCQRQLIARGYNNYTMQFYKIKEEGVDFCLYHRGKLKNVEMMSR